MPSESNNMYSMIIIDMDGNEEEEYIETSDLTRISMLCGFNNSKSFKHIHAWHLDKDENIIENHDKDLFLHLYASTKGHHENINKFELPPPIDNVIYYGYIGIILEDEDHQLYHLDKNTWKKCYEALYNGFYDLGESDTDEGERDVDTDNDEEYDDDDDENGYEDDNDGEDENDENDNRVDTNKNKTIEKRYTKEGYLIDDFVVEDSDDIQFYEEWV